MNIWTWVRTRGNPTYMDFKLLANDSFWNLDISEQFYDTFQGNVRIIKQPAGWLVSRMSATDGSPMNYKWWCWWRISEMVCYPPMKKVTNMILAISSFCHQYQCNNCKWRHWSKLNDCGYSLFAVYYLFQRNYKSRFDIQIIKLFQNLPIWIFFRKLRFFFWFHIWLNVSSSVGPTTNRQPAKSLCRRLS